MYYRFFKTSYLLILIFGFSCLFYLWQSNRTLVQNNKNLNNDILDLQYSIERTTQKYKQSIFSENIKVENVNLLDIRGNNVLLHTKIDKTKLIYLFFEDTCLECVEDEIEILLQLADIIGVNNIMILSNYTKMNKFKAFMNRKSVNIPFYLYEDSLGLLIENDDKSLSSFFLLNESCTTDFVLQAGGFQNINNPYFQRIIKYFLDGN